MMDYEMTAPQGQTVVHQQYVTKKPMSRWWPVSFFIASVIFFIIGGALIGSWATSYDGYDYYTNGNWYGAIACFVIASLLKLAAWILLIIWCVRRSRTTSATTVTYVNAPPANNAYATMPMQVPPQSYGQQPYDAQQPAKSATPAPVYQNVEAAPMQYGEAPRYCSNCGTAVTAQFCAQCGAKVF
jgi:hypothetical protein